MSKAEEAEGGSRGSQTKKQGGWVPGEAGLGPVRGRACWLLPLTGRGGRSCCWNGAVPGESPAFPSPTCRCVLFELRCHVDVLTSILGLHLLDLHYSQP